MTRNIDIIRRFIQACDGRHMDEVVAFFAPDAVYHNMPMEPVIGPESVREVLKGFGDVSSDWDWEVHHIAETADGVVLTERTDRIRVGDQWFGFPCMGAFELRGGLITAWRDHFDLAQAMATIEQAAAARQR